MDKKDDVKLLNNILIKSIENHMKEENEEEIPISSEIPIVRLKVNNPGKKNWEVYKRERKANGKEMPILIKILTTSPAIEHQILLREIEILIQRKFEKELLRYQKALNEIKEIIIQGFELNEENLIFWSITNITKRKGKDVRNASREILYTFLLSSAILQRTGFAPRLFTDEELDKAVSEETKREIRRIVNDTFMMNINVIKETNFQKLIEEIIKELEKTYNEEKRR